MLRTPIQFHVCPVYGLATVYLSNCVLIATHPRELSLPIPSVPGCRTAESLLTGASESARQCYLPGPKPVAAFIDAMAVQRAPATVRRYVSSISHLHRAAGLATPCNDELVRLSLRRMHRARGRRGSQKLGLTRDLVDRMLAASDRTSLKGFRDCALLSAAYDTLCRRSELVAADVEHLTISDDGSGSLFLPTSKTDQEGNGTYRYLAPDTMRHLSAYLVAAGHIEGPLFRAAGRGGRKSWRLSGETVARIYKGMAKAASIDLCEVSGHSTRIGKAQDCVAAGIGIAAIMRDGGWKNEAMVARYTEHLQLKQSASARLSCIQKRT